jgi:CubicO group peptidase (beta-lactamase class C family)
LGSEVSKLTMTGQKTVRTIVSYVVAVVFSMAAGPSRTAGQGKPTRSTDLSKLADDYFGPLVANKRVTAAAVIVTDKERPAFSKVYGPIDLERSVWRAASVSKALTAIAVMRLVEQGKVELDTDVNRYLKTFQIPSTFPQPITLRHLLEHRSGLDDRFVGDGFRNGEQPSMQSLMKRVLPARVYAPNQVEFYSNYGYGLIGAVIEDVSGERFEDYVSANVLRPLRMNRSTFMQPLTQDLVSVTVPGKWWYQHAAPAGGLATTGADMAAFLLATLEQDAGVISKSSFQAMTPPQDTPSGLAHRFGYWTGRDHRQQLIGASGDAGSFHTVLVAVPDHRLGLVVLVSGSGSGLAWGFYSRFLDAEFGTTPLQTLQSNKPLQPKAGDYERCSRFAGLYRTVRYPHRELSKTFIILDLTRVAVERDGALRFRGARWIQTGPLQFEKEDGSETASFKEDNTGRIRFLGDTEEKIAWYASGFANIAFYFLFTMFFGVALWRDKGALRWLCGLALLHSLGWLAIVLIIGPENLIFGLPLPLKALLWIGTAVPLMAVSGIYLAWRDRTILAVTAAVVLACYVPFVFYWNLRA